MTSDISWVRKSNGQPLIAYLILNNNIKFYKKNIRNVLEFLFLHHITHILGFNLYHFKNYFNNMITIMDIDGIKRNYINSTKVIQVAKKYFNCTNIKGVELEEYGGTVSAHWEARILLGDYMNLEYYYEEQVISEFTLALLEDTGFYKANYYTGGLMRFGKNKGCKFINEKCV